MKFKWRSLVIILIAVVVISAVFFIFTSTLSSPTVMELNMPKDENGSNYQNSNSKLTLVLLKNDMIFGYFGNDIINGSSLEIKEVRKIIAQGVQKFTRDSLIVIIKPSKEATYKNSVDVLDEMTINKITRYEMVDLTKEEKEFLAKR
ncbi:MAG TPA: biopolymer transporter ExbD [Chitinophagaceae bacterium]|jgi:biopolymer transport protein ExbD|nr:biopolymer transporter ExbD [Chitinophagaceae bacterium]